MKIKLFTLAAVSALGIGSLEASSLVGNWTFSDGSNLGQDSSGNGYNLTAAGTGGPTFDSAARGGQGAAVFSGGDWFVDSSAFPSLLPTGNSPYTLLAWIQLGTTTQGGYGVIGWGGYSAANQTNAFRTSSPSSMDNYWFSNDNIASQGAGTDNIYDGSWHLVAATYDGTTRTVYVDPQLGNGYSNSDTPGTHNTQAANFTVGQTNFSENFIGELSDVQVYNAALTSSEIVTAADQSTVPEPGSLGLCLSGMVLLALKFRPRARRLAELAGRR